MNEKLEKVQTAVSQFGFTAEANDQTISVRNSKGLVCAEVTDKVYQKFSGNKNLCGSLVVRAINSALGL